MDSVVIISETTDEAEVTTEKGIFLAGSVRVVNSDETYDVTVSTDDSPHEVPDTEAIPKNSVGDAIGPAAMLPSGVSGGATTAADVTHKDSDDSSVTLPAGVPFVATICAPATFKINTATVRVVAPGGEEDVPVVDSSLNPTGAFDGTRHVIPDIEFLTNGVSHTFLKAQGGQFNVATKINGVVQQGSYNTPTDTLSFTTDPTAVRYDCDSRTGTIAVFYVGYGYADTLDTDSINIKRVTITPSTGAVVEAYATDSWTNHLTATYL